MYNINNKKEELLINKECSDNTLIFHLILAETRIFFHINRTAAVPR